MYEERLAKFRAQLAEKGIDAFYMRNESDIRWITGFDGVFDGEGAFALIVTADQALLHTDSRYAVATERAAVGTAFTVNLEPKAHAAVAAQLAQDVLGSQPAFAVETSLTLGEFRRLEQKLEDAGCSASIAETDGIGVNLRAVKDADEVRRLRAAQAITDAGFQHLREFVKPGMTEREVQVELEDFMMRHGAEGLAFSSIVAAGEHGASPHAIPGDTKLEAGQCVVCDFGARAAGYCSDMTRMLFLGQPSEKVAHAYSVLREANETVERTLKPGVTGAQMHQLAEDILAAGGYGGKMGHGLGHGVGIDIHEQPNLSPRNSQPLCAGNVVTVEPGIYLAGEFGMRLEDFGILTETGYEVFTTSTHEMVII